MPLMTWGEFKSKVDEFLKLNDRDDNTPIDFDIQYDLESGDDIPLEIDNNLLLIG